MSARRGEVLKVSTVFSLSEEVARSRGPRELGWFNNFAGILGRNRASDLPPRRSRGFRRIIPLLNAYTSRAREKVGRIEKMGLEAFYSAKSSSFTLRSIWLLQSVGRCTYIMYISPSCARGDVIYPGLFIARQCVTSS